MKKYIVPMVRGEESLLNNILIKFKQMSYWHVPHPTGNLVDTKNLKGFHIDFSDKTNFTGYMKEGIPKVLYGDSYFFNPITIAQYALGHYEKYLHTKDHYYSKTFLCQAEWLTNNYKEKNGGCCWEFMFDFSPYSLKSPWISAMAQGEVIAVLLRAHLQTNEEKFVLLAKSALKPFYLEVDQGGVRSKVNGHIFYEEYPSKSPTHVLNGFIYALFGLYDYTVYIKSQESKELFDKGIETLVNSLPLYDTGSWSKYDLSKRTNVASVFYHQLHINQLRALYKITNIKVFNDYANKWEKYLSSPVNRSVATVRKAYYKLIG